MIEKGRVWVYLHYEIAIYGINELMFFWQINGDHLIKWSLDFWWISGKTIMEVTLFFKTCYFSKFSSARLLKHTITFFMIVLFNIFTRQTLKDDFWGLHKNMNCAFTLNHAILDTTFCRFQSIFYHPKITTLRESDSNEITF